MKLKTVIAEYKRWGVLRCVYLWAMTAQRRWLFLCFVNRRPHLVNSATVKLAPNRSVRIATKEELLKTVTDPELDLTREFIIAAYDRGDFCIAVFEEDKILSYTWRALKIAPHEDGLWVEIKPPDIYKYTYGYKALTRRANRGQHLQHAVGYFTDKMLRERGQTHIIGIVETHNFPSLLSDAARGHQHVGYAGYLKLFGYVIPFRTPGAKRHGFRFFRPKENLRK